MPIPLLSTKFYIPRTRPGAVARPRLSSKLLEGIQRPGTLLLVSCPAGFGKTTLLSEFVQGLEIPPAWISLDEADNDPIRFWAAVITALQRIRPGTGEAALGLLEMPVSLPDEAIPTLLVNELAAVEDAIVLILDDYHVIRDQAIQTAFGFLLDHLPDNLHIVVSTRMDPPWPLARFRARNQLVELRSADLRFSSEETLAFLNDTMSLQLSPAEAAALEARTEGWAASLQLAAVSMQGRSDIPAFVQAFTGSHTYVAEYLVEEVLKRQPESLQAFLLQTSILERLSPALCEAVTGDPEAPSRLASLRQKNLFIVPLDDEGDWYRYHHLFADLLRARLRRAMPPEAVASLHRRASDWYQGAAMLDDAVAHAFAASDYSHALGLVEQAALPMILQAYVRTVEAWLQAFPAGYISRSPRANMAFAWMHLLRGTLSEAGPYLERLESMFPAAAEAGGDPALRAEWLAIQGRLLVAQGKALEARELAEEALRLVPPQDVHVRCMLYVNLAMACQQLIEYEAAAQAFAMIVQDAQQTGNFALETLGVSGRARMLLQQGQLRLAARVASGGVKRLEASGRVTPFGATLYGELGQIHYYWHRLDEAREWFQRSAKTSGHSGYSDPEIFLHIVSSRMFQMEGKWDEAGREIGEAAALAQAIPPAMVGEELIAQQVVVHLASGRIPAAEAVLKPEGFMLNGSFSAPPLAPDSSVAHPLGLLYNSAFRIMLAKATATPGQVNLEQALEPASTVLAGELLSCHIPIAMQTLLLRSEIHSLLGNEKAALDDLTQAVELARPEAFISPFLEGGPEAARALRSLIKSDRLDAASSGYVESVLAAFPQPASPSAVPIRRHVPADELPVQSLTPRELEVLALIALGDPNQAIAEKLVITLSAVKKHTGNIFHKLNVNNRTQALIRARQLSLLPPDP
jgi:LuxR family maltose regulon positive regulatory protein